MLACMSVCLSVNDFSTATMCQAAAFVMHFAILSQKRKQPFSTRFVALPMSIINHNDDR